MILGHFLAKIERKCHNAIDFFSKVCYNGIMVEIAGSGGNQVC